MADKEAPQREAYHHGNLQGALIDAAIAVIEERGVEKLSVREVAKLAGVSPGAPFRHFKSKQELLRAVAEQSIDRFHRAALEELALVDPADPIAGIRAMGRGYLNWAYFNPTQFAVVSSRTLIHFYDSPKLVQANEVIRTSMGEYIRRAQAMGRADLNVSVEDMIFAARAFVYGVARMWIDGHFDEWHTSRPPLEAMHHSLDMFIATFEVRA